MTRPGSEVLGASVRNAKERWPVAKVEIATPAPDFELADFAGATFRLADHRGKSNVLLVFNRGFT